MAFDADRFNNAPVTLRTGEYRLKELQHFFDEGEDPVFKVRQLTGEELAQCHEAAKLNRDVSELVAGLMANDSHEKVEAVLAAMGRGSSRVPDEHAKRIEMLVLASVEPRMDRSTVVRLGTNFPVDFMLLTNVISGLSGQGAILGESSDSGTLQPSESPAPSAGSKAAASLN